jgi:hypothetical protein
VIDAVVIAALLVVALRTPQFAKSTTTRIIIKAGAADAVTVETVGGADVAVEQQGMDQSADQQGQRVVVQVDINRTAVGSSGPADAVQGWQPQHFQDQQQQKQQHQEISHQLSHQPGGQAPTQPAAATNTIGGNKQGKTGAAPSSLGWAMALSIE